MKALPDNHQLPSVPIQLEYASDRKTSWARQTGPLLLLTFGTIAVLMLCGFGFEEGSYGLCCDNCRARATVKEFHWFGIGGRYGWKTSEGPVAKFIQNGTPCAHKWAVVRGGSHGWAWRACVCGKGASDEWIFKLECEPSLPSILSAESLRDPTFKDRFTNALIAPDLSTSEQFLADLFERCSAK